MSPSSFVRPRTGAFAALALIGLALGPRSIAAQGDLIIYRDGRVLVRRQFAIAVPAGISHHLIELDQFDSGSLVALDSGVRLSDVRYPRELDEATLYRTMLGRRLLFEVEGTRDTVSALVVGDDPMRFEIGNGQVRLTAPGIPLFPRELVGRARPTRIALESDRALSRVTLGYVTNGATWTSEYSVLLGAAGAEISGRVVLASTDMRADSAQISVLEGQVARASGFRRQGNAQYQPYRLEEVVVTGAARGAAARQFTSMPIGVGGFRLYPVPGRHTLVPGQTTVGTLLPVTRVEVERVHAVSAGGLAPGRAEEVLPVEVRYRIARPRTTPFGNRALPPGLARLYARTPGGTSVLVGEAAVEHADPGQALELVAGQSVEIIAKRLPVRMTMVSDSIIGADRRPLVSVSGQVADGEVRFSNGTDTLAVVELTEVVPAPGVLVSSSVPAVKADGTLLFTVRVPARGEAVLRYRVRLSQ
jgi:hypothetical protein